MTQSYAARQSLFTYASPKPLEKFQYVFIPLQKKTVTGIVVKNVSMPSFATKEIVKSLPYFLNPGQQKLISFIKQFYMATEAQALEPFIPSFLQTDFRPAKETASPPQFAASPLPPLTSEQTSALQTLRSPAAQGTVIVHGDTGTGKTRLFIERIKDTLAQHKTVLLLCPEIALVPHLHSELTKQFGHVVGMYHSSLTPKKRSSVWQQVQDGTLQIVVGTRSALFLPLHNVGLIVLDESHEPAYKQEEGVRYHATRLASVLAHSFGAQLLLASATPLVVDIYRALEQKRPIIRLTKPAITSDHTVETHVIDMKQKDVLSSNSLVSLELVKKIETALQNKEQALVYLNRRGTARAILCASCGWQAVCPTCSVAMTYHHDHHELKCHTCGLKMAVPHSCPACRSNDILFKSAGTKALAQWLQKRFPGSVVARFDTDNSKSESLAERHNQVKEGAIDILVGTQMLVKGLDLPKLAVVGILAADLSLQIPDYSAEERTYQLINQAIGRVGRGHRMGNVILQTYNPDNKVIQQALAKNYDDFYTTQIEQRLLYAYPPLTDIAVLWCFKKSAQAALKHAVEVLDYIRKNNPKVTFVGPALSLHSNKVGYATAQIVVKSTQRSLLNNVVQNLPNGWQYDLEPVQLL